VNNVLEECVKSGYGLIKGTWRLFGDAEEQYENFSQDSWTLGWTSS
jgi:hypothetical protein